jgi:hypothetical protein
MTKNEKSVDKVYKLKRNAAPLTYMLPSRNSRRFPLLWFDEDNNTNKALRYAVNQKSPFEDEQDGNAIVEPIIFEDGFLTVPRTNPVLQQFLFYHPQRDKVFIEVDNEKDASVEVEKLNAEVDALIEARQLSVDQVETVGRVLFGKDISKVTTSELRRDILVYAKRDPRGFLNMMNDPMLQLQSKVQLFFDKGFLSFRNKQKDVFYNTDTNKKKMLTVPYGEDPMYIVASFLKSDDGIESLKLLENLIANKE